MQKIKMPWKLMIVWLEKSFFMNTKTKSRFLWKRKQKVVFYEHKNKRSFFMKTKTKSRFLWTRKQKVVFMNMKKKSCFLWTWKQKFVFYEHENKKKAYPGNKSVVYCTFHHRTSFWILQNSILVAQWEDHSLAFGLALSPWRQ